MDRRLRAPCCTEDAPSGYAQSLSVCSGLLGFAIPDSGVPLTPAADAPMVVSIAPVTLPLETRH